MAKPRRVGLLTAGGDSPGLNAAIRGFGKAAIGHYGMRIVGFDATVLPPPPQKFVLLIGRLEKL